MSRAYTPTSKVNPCPICDDTSGKCRTKDDGGKEFILCMNFGDSKFGELVNGYKCIKEASPNKSYFASTWTIDNSTEWGEEKRREWERRKQEKKDHQAREMAERKRRSLSPVERDKGYRAILDQLELHPDDRADLIRRGFTDKQIELSGFKSVQPHQFLKTGVNPNLPGVTKNGKELVVKADGYLIPVKNVDGLITGCQIRLRTPIDGNRYLWLSSQNVLHLFPDGSTQGELPLAVYKPQGKPSGLALVEGTGAKPFLVANRLNALVIGAAGGQWTSSRNTWQHTLKELGSEVTSEEIAIYPDAGDILNPSVMNRWRNVILHLQNLGYKVTVKWWNQVTKDDCDIDELSDYSQIKDITTDDFFALQSQSEIEQLTRNQKAWEQWRNKKGFTGDIKIDWPYISDVIKTPKSGYATLINSGLGSGKTTLIYKTEQENPDTGFVAFGARNNLLRQFAGETGAYHLQDDLKGDEIAMKLLADPQSKVVCCIDSIIHFRPEHFDDKILYLDEIEATLKQLVLAGTAVSQWRERAKYLLIEAFKRCDRIIGLDGNLKDSTAKLLEEIFQNHGIDKKIVRIKNLDNSLTSNQVRFYLGAEVNGEINQNNRSIFLKYLLGSVGEAPFVVVADSQVFLEALDNQLKNMGLSGLRIDSSTTRTEEVANFLKDANAPKQWILRNKPDYLLLSPSLENGGNIDIPGYFKNIYAYFCGVLSTDEQCQILRRVRDSEATIHIFCKPVGMPSRAVSTSPFPHEIESAVKEFMNDCAHATFEGLDHHQALTKLTEHLTEISAKSEFFKYECEVKAIANHERFHLRQCLYETLKAKGYQVESFTECKTVDPLKTREEEVKNLISEIIAESEVVSTEKAEEILRDPRVSRDEKCKALKRRYLDKLPGIEDIMIDKLVTVSQEMQDAEGNIATTTHEKLAKVPLFDANFIRLITYDDRKLISNMETFYLLNHPEQAKLIQQNRWYRMLEPTVSENPENLKLSTNYHSVWLRVKTLLEIGITKFFEPGTTWNSQDSRVVEIYQKAKNPKVARDIGIKPGKDTPGAFVGRLLKSLGFTTESQRLGTENAQGSRERIYCVKETPFTDPVKSAILNCIERRITAKMAETEVKNFAQILQVSDAQNACEERVSCRPPSADISLIKTEEGGRNLESQSVAIANSVVSTVSDPPENTTADNGGDMENLAAAMAVVEDLAAVKNLVERFGFERCDDALIFVPWERRGFVSRLLKSVLLEPQAALESEAKKDAQYIAQMWADVCSESDPIAAQEFAQDIYSVMSEVVEHYGEWFKKLVWGCLDMVQKARVKFLLSPVPHPS